MSKIKLSVTLATYNEENNIARSLESIKDLADEIIIVDGSSIDNTVKLAKKYTKKITVTTNPSIFHINKNKANDLARGEWVLQIDADEVVTQRLAKEIHELVNSKQTSINQKYQTIPHLFKRHQHLIEARHPQTEQQKNPNNDLVAFYIPRRNLFLNKFLKYGGTYPDGVIRLFRNGVARFTETSVHDQYQIKGQTSWLHNYLKHYDSPNFTRYLQRNNRYSSLFAKNLEKTKTPISLYNHIKYLYLKPINICLKLYFRHKGFLDGFPGLVWSMYSGKTWADAWIKYWEKVKQSPSLIKSKN